jgi:glyoxylase-like metal-dependent hydrolase (beta-lactamase superfamily II)
MGGIRNAPLLISAAEAKERVIKIQHLFDKRTSTQIGDALFVGDTIFMPDYGTAWCDFPRGSAEILYESIQGLYTLPEYINRHSPACRVCSEREGLSL